MGNSTRRLKRFLAQHPLCCYCGGYEVATTQDHFPPRSIFPGRLWPEGYVFPACATCNGTTSPDEAIVALLARIYPEARSSNEQEEVTRIMQAVAELHPELFRSLFPAANKVRKWLRDRNESLPPGMTTKDVPMMSIDHPRIIEAVERFATKLFCSLYYMHTKEALNPKGGIVFRWFSNAQNLDELLPRDVVAPLLTTFPTLTRQGTSLHSEFTYRYGIASDTGRAGAFLVSFRESIAMLGFAFPDVDKVKVPNGATVLHPFTWGQSTKPPEYQTR